MGRPATGRTPGHSIRVPDDVWDEALENTQAEDTTISEIVVAALRRYNAAARRRLTKQPPADH